MKIGFVSLRCPKNPVDSEVMLGMAGKGAHEITGDASEADGLGGNACALIDRAKQESIDTILEMAELKKQAAGRRLIVTGCLAERYRDELKKEIPEIDAVLGTGEVPQILAAIEEGAVVRDPGSGIRSSHAQPLRLFRASDFAQSSNDRLAGSPIPDPGPRQASVTTYIYDSDTPRLLTTPGHYAYVKIAEGCDYTCAFCIIPTLRGKYRSRSAESIVREARTLASRGIRELLLISQDTTFYGIDRGERGALGLLLRELNAIDGLEWIRLLYLYPTTITDDVLDAMADCEKICRYVDLPLQHASATVLKRMGRPGHRKTYDRLLARIRERVPGVALRTTLIVGFPGETEAEFGELEGFVADTGFDHVGVFTYSHEEGTRAFGFTDDVPAAEKRRRRNALMARQKKIVAAAQKSRIGSEVDVLVDGPSAEHELVLQGRLESQAPDIDPVVFLTDCDPEQYRRGQLIRARIVGAKGYDLLATPIGELVSR